MTDIRENPGTSHEHPGPRPRALELPVPGDPAVLSPRRGAPRARPGSLAAPARARTHRPRGTGAGGA
ncbi:hypothetical protein CapIbe_021166 [Capra ibex]